MTTNHRERPATTPPAGTGALNRAWVAAALIPVFFGIAFVLGYVLYDLLGYQPEDNDAPLWVDLAVAVAVLAVTLVPCAGAVRHGRRAIYVGDRRGWIPLAIGALAGLAVTVLTAVTTIAGALD